MTGNLLELSSCYLFMVALLIFMIETVKQLCIMVKFIFTRRSEIVSMLIDLGADVNKNVGSTIHMQKEGLKVSIMLI